jgi:phosphoribosylformylglycinamidine cyclo-ligase
MYAAGHDDLAGFAVGAAERGNLLPAQLSPGDALIALPSSGVHSNGFSLVRRICAGAGLGWGDPAPFAPTQTLGQALMAPTRLYVHQVLALHRAGLLLAAAHITGGGLPGNLPRVLTPGVGAAIDRAWPVPPVFGWLQSAGRVAEAEMLSVFNCGIGMVLAVTDQKAALALLECKGEPAFPIGRIEAAPGEAGLRIDLPAGFLAAW